MTKLKNIPLQRYRAVQITNIVSVLNIDTDTGYGSNKHCLVKTFHRTGTKKEEEVTDVDIFLGELIKILFFTINFLKTYVHALSKHKRSS